MNAQDSSGKESESGDDKPEAPASSRRRLNEWGWIMAMIAVAVVVTIVILGTIVICGAGEGAVIALAVAPGVLALVAAIWPLPIFRRPLAEADLKEPPAAGRGATKDPKNEEALEHLLAVATEQLEEEREKTKALSDRAGVLLGFSGVILGLIAGEAKDVFEHASSLGSVGRPVGAWLLAAAAVMTVISAADAIVVLLRRRSRRIKTKALFRFLEESYWDKSRGELLYKQLKSRVLATRRNRVANEELRRWFNAGVVSLVAALLFLLVHIGVYLQRSVETPCRRSAQQASKASVSADGGGTSEEKCESFEEEEDALPMEGAVRNSDAPSHDLYGPLT